MSRDLTTKRIQVFEKLVAQYNGRVVPFNDWLREDKGSFEAFDFMIVGECMALNFNLLAQALADEFSVHVDTSTLSTKVRSFQELQQCIKTLSLAPLQDQPVRKQLKLSFRMVPIFAMTEVLKEERKTLSNCYSSKVSKSDREIVEDIPREKMQHSNHTGMITKEVPGLNPKKFVCQNTEERVNLNRRVTAQLEQLSQRYKNDKDTW